MTEQEKQVVEKVEKLLALATSSNENEARLAAEKASELLTRYNLTVEQVKSADDKKFEEIPVLERDGAKKQQDKYIGDLMARFFFVHAVATKNRDHKQNGEPYLKVRLVGTPANIKVASFVYEFLQTKFPECYKRAKLASVVKINRESYYHGLWLGLKLQLTETTKKVETETGLMVIKDKALEKYLRDSGVSTRSTTTNASDEKSINLGIEHGKNLKIVRGVSGNTNHTGERRALTC